MVPEHLEPHERKGGGCRQDQPRSPARGVRGAARYNDGDHDAIMTAGVSG